MCRVRATWLGGAPLALLGALALALTSSSALGQQADPADPADPADVTQPPPRVPRHYVRVSEGMPEQPITAVAIDPGDPEVMLAGLDGFVFKSDDAGQSWRPVLSFPRGLSVEAEALVDEDDELEAPPPPSLPRRARDGDLERALDDADLEDADDAEELEELQDEIEEAGLGGRARDDVMLPAGDADLRQAFAREEPGVRAIVYVAANKPTVFVATPRGLFRSLDGGESFTQLELPGGVLANDVRDLSVDERKPSILWVATAAGTLVSLDGGVFFGRYPDSWGATPALAVLTKSVSAEQHLVLVGTARGIMRSWDNGQTFREMLLKGVSAFEGVGAVAFDERTGITYAATLKGLFAGERDAAILEPREASSGEAVLSLSVDPRRERGVAVGLVSRGVEHSDDTGITYVTLPDTLPALHAYSLARPSDDPDALVAATERGVFRFVKGTGIQVTEDRIQHLVRQWKKEPTLNETARAALAYAQIDPWPLDGMATRARLGALVPELRGSFRYKKGRPDEEVYVVAVEDPDAFDEDDDEELVDLARDGILVDAPSRGVTWGFFVLATWDLDRVLFHPTELSAARQVPTLHSSRRRILNEVEKLYSARRRLMAELYLADSQGAPREQAARTLRLAELTALLSAATGGAFVDIARSRGAKLEELGATP